MPQTSSSRKKKAGHKPAHQNTFAYRHNPNSKRTQQILSSPNVGLCRRCHAKIEWRKQYRKYKPLTQPSACNICSERTVIAAYHTICDKCAVSPEAYDKMMASLMESGIQLEQSCSSSVPSFYNSTSECESNNNEDDDNNLPSGINQPTHPLISTVVCAMCVKEPALTDASTKSHTQEIIQTEINAQVERKEKILGRALKLREMKALERKVKQIFHEEKEKLRAERRNAASAAATEDPISQLSDVNNNGYGDEEEGNSVDSSEEHLDSDNEFNVDDDKKYEYDLESPDDSDDDPFLKAVGGAQNLLVGEAYRHRILEIERQQQGKG